ASSSVRSAGRATISVRGVITSRALFSLNSNTPWSSRASSASSLPRFWLCSTSIRSSSGEWMRSSSAVVPFTPSSRTTRLALRFKSSVNGRVLQENRGDGDAELRRRELAVEILQRRLHRLSLPVAAPHERFDARAAGGHEREFRGDEERIRQHERHQRREAQAERFGGGSGHRGRNIPSGNS